MLDGPSPRQPAPAAEPLTRQELEAWMDNMPLNHLVCRSKKHNMQLKDCWQVGKSGLGMLYRCNSCRLEATEVLNAAGFIVDRKLEYPKGYLAPKGAGRVTRERNGALRIRRARRFMEAKKK